MTKSSGHDITVCLISSHPLFLREYSEVLGDRFRIKAERVDPSPWSEPLPSSLPAADAYVLDTYSRPQQTELLVSALLTRYAGARVLILAEDFPDSSAFPLLRLGAKGLLRYGDARQQLARAIQKVVQGGYWGSRDFLDRFVDSVLHQEGRRAALKGTAGLSRREKEVIDCLLQNLSNKEIASKLNISERTAKFHVSNLLAKYGVQRRADLILLCYQERSPGEPRVTEPARIG